MPVLCEDLPHEVSPLNMGAQGDVTLRSFLARQHASFQSLSKDIRIHGCSTLQDVQDELHVQAMILEVASRGYVGNMIELLTPIDIGKGPIKKT